MYVNTGYLNHAETDLENPQIPLRINSSGIYRVISRPSMSTLRPKGRLITSLSTLPPGGPGSLSARKRLKWARETWSFCAPSSDRSMSTMEKINRRPSGYTLQGTGQKPYWMPPDLHKIKFCMPVFFRIQGPVFPDDTGTSGVPSGL